MANTRKKFVPSNGTTAKTTTMSQEWRSGVDESNILAGRRTQLIFKIEHIKIKYV